MPQRQAVDFLRRRYATAILRDDADTACRLRAQLDALMNPRAGRFGRALPHEASGPTPAASEALALEAHALEAKALKAGSTPDRRRFAPRLIVAAPVTGLLEARRLLPRAAPPVTAPRDSGHITGEGSAA